MIQEQKPIEQQVSSSSNLAVGPWCPFVAEPKREPVGKEEMWFAESQAIMTGRVGLEPKNNLITVGVQFSQYDYKPVF